MNSTKIASMALIGAALGGGITLIGLAIWWNRLSDEEKAARPRLPDWIGTVALGIMAVLCIAMSILWR